MRVVVLKVNSIYSPFLFLWVAVVAIIDVLS